MNGTKEGSDVVYLPATEDLLGLIKEWLRQTGVSESQLADHLDIDVSDVSRTLSGKRQLLYDEVARAVDYLLNRLSPLPPKETISSILRDQGELVKVYTHEKVSAAAHALREGNFTQVPLYDIEDGPPERYRGLVTDRMILQRLLHPNVNDFKGEWVDWLRNMTIKEAELIETSVTYLPSDSLSSVASALTHFYAVMLGEENKAPLRIVTRWDFLKLLDK
jgi:predicted transcriptional regulator